MTTRTVTECLDCPFMYFNTGMDESPTADGSCQLPGGPLEINENEPPPEDCPLRASPVLKGTP